MAAFDLLNSCKNNCNDDVAGVENSNNNRIKDECIIAFKVYDFCRIQECLTCEALGPARAQCDTTCCNQTINAGDIIKPPQNATSVTVENLKVKKVIVANKKQNPFRPGYWDIELKFIFVYRLIFRDIDGDEICNIKAQSSYATQLTLFGSLATETLVSTDLFATNGNSVDMDADPFVLVESKAVSLSSEIRFTRCCCGDDEPLEATDVVVTIGLFAIIKLFRLVNLVVESRGFCIPDQCENISALEPCEFFESLDFPMDLFAPPQRPEFVAGISSNIPANKKEKKCRDDNSAGNAGCGCGNVSNSGCGCGNVSNSGCGCGCGC